MSIHQKDKKQKCGSVCPLTLKSLPLDMRLHLAVFLVRKDVVALASTSVGNLRAYLARVHLDGQRSKAPMDMLESPGITTLTTSVLLDKWPPNLKHLIFKRHFNQELKVGVLPAGLSNVTFGQDFTQEIGVGVLPAGLTTLTFNYNSHFNQPLGVGVLPAGLTNLEFGWVFQPSAGCWCTTCRTN